MDATLSPVTASVRWRGGSRSPRNISQDNLTHWLISTQARGPRAAPDARTRVPPARPGRRREAHDEPLRHVRPAHAAVPRRRHHHGAGARRSPLADREALALALADGVPGPSADADGSGPVVLRRAGPGGALHRSGARLRRGLAAGAAGAAVGRVDRDRRPAGPGAGPGRRPRRFAPGLCCSGPGAGPLLSLMTIAERDSIFGGQPRRTNVRTLCRPRETFEQPSPSGTPFRRTTPPHPTLNMCPGTCADTVPRQPTRTLIIIYSNKTPLTS